MSDEDWHADRLNLMIYLNGDGIPDRNELGERVVDDSFLLLFNAGHRQTMFTLPDQTYGRAWQTVVDTNDPLLAHTRRRYPLPGSKLRLPPRSTLVLLSPSRRE